MQLNNVGLQFIQWVNYSFDIFKVSYELGLIRSDAQVDQNVLCPFHDNHNTAAARLYSSSNSLYCFGQCSRHFHSYDLIHRVGHMSFEVLWSLLKQRFYAEYDPSALIQQSQQFLVSNKDVNLQAQSAYRSGQISFGRYSQYLDEFLYSN